MYASRKVSLYLSAIGFLVTIVGAICLGIAANMDCYGYDDYYCDGQALFLNVSGITLVVPGGIMLFVALIMYCRTKNSPEPTVVSSTTAVTYPSGVIYPPTSTQLIYPQVYPPVTTLQGYPQIHPSASTGQGYPQIYPSASTEQGYPQVPPPAYSPPPYPPAYGEQQQKG
ncbi:uncharacterized protein LOC119586957 [Penaeus monodon]|uniref:uncharacterized protein LOC119586957 n=1 Tax=Penaeus monodon TaxID=6687 RepID=UPI0018A767D8|nr:uncharacterized protein LOC119586957 [Penaeus monodon]